MPDFTLDEVQCHLDMTATLAETISEKCLKAHRNYVSNKKVLSILGKDNFNGGTTGETYEYVRCYGQIEDCVLILEDRIRIASSMLDKIICQETHKQKGRQNEQASG